MPANTTDPGRTQRPPCKRHGFRAATSGLLVAGLALSPITAAFAEPLFEVSTITNPNSALGYPSFHGSADPMPDSGVPYSPGSYMQEVFNHDVASGAGSSVDKDFWFDKILARYGNAPTGPTGAIPGINDFGQGGTRGTGTTDTGSYTYLGSDSNSWLFSRGRAAFMKTHDPARVGFAGNLAYFESIDGRDGYVISAKVGNVTLSLTEDAAKRKQTPSYWRSVFTTSDPAITIVETKFITNENVLVTNLDVKNSGTTLKEVTLTATSPYASINAGDELTGTTAARGNVTTITSRFSGNGFTPQNGTLSQTLIIGANAAATTKVQLGLTAKELPGSTTEYEQLKSGTWTSPAAAYQGHVTAYNKWWADNLPYIETPEANIDKTIAYRWWLSRFNSLDANMPGNTYQFPISVEGALGYNNAIVLTVGMFLEDTKYFRDPSLAYGSWVSAGETSKSAQYRDNPGDNNWNNSYTQFITEAAWDSYKLHGGPAQIAEALGTYGENDLNGLLTQNSATNRNGNHLVDWNAAFMTGNDADAVSFDVCRGSAMDRAESAYLYSSALSAAGAYRSAGNAAKADQMDALAANIKKDVLDLLWDSGDDLIKHSFTASRTCNSGSKETAVTAGQKAEWKEVNNYYPYAVGLMPSAGDTDYTDDYEEALRLFADADQYPIFPFFTANQVDKAERGAGGSNNFSIINSQVIFRIYQAALRKYHAGENGYITPEAYKKLLYWSAFSHYQGGDNRYPDQNEFWHTGTAENGGRIDYRSWIHHTQLGTTNWTYIEDIAGLTPREDKVIELDPIAMPGWDHFTVNNLRYHDKDLTIVWNADGHYDKAGVPAGYSVYLDGERAFTIDKLAHVRYDTETGKVTIVEGNDATVTSSNAQPIKAAQEIEYSETDRVTDIFAKAGRNVSTATTPEGRVNVAKGSAVSTSFSADEATRPAKAAVDGTTINEPFWTPKGSPNPSDSFTVNFGAQKTIDDIRLYFYQSSTSLTVGGYAEPQSYTLEYLDGTEWKVIPNQSKAPLAPQANYNRVQFPKITTAQIRATFRPQSGSAVGLKEIEAFGTGIAAPNNVRNAGPVIDAYVSGQVGGTTKITGTLKDDGLPLAAELTGKWSVLKAPTGGTVNFTSLDKPTTDLTVTKSGTYTIRLTATDGEVQSTKDVTFQGVEGPSGENAAKFGTPTASYTASWNRLTAVNNGTILYSGGAQTELWGTWSENGTRPASQWLQYDWTTPQRIDSADMSFWYDNTNATTSTGVQIPDAWKLQYWDASTSEWRDIESNYTRAVNATNFVTFEPVTTTKLRAVFQAHAAGDGRFAAVGVSEFGVYSDEPTSIESRYLLTDSASKVQDLVNGVTSIEATYEDGTRVNLPVTWESPDTSTGRISVAGDVRGALAAATLHVSVTTTEFAGINNYEPINLVTPKTVAPKLPKYAVVLYNDGSQESLEVAWDNIDPASYDGSRQMFTVKGTVAAHGLTADVSATVTVLGAVESRTPGAPTDVTAALQGTDVVVSWKKPADDGGADITNYRIYAEGQDEPLAVVDAATLSHTISGLAPESTTRFTVTAVNRVGEGDRSEWTDAVTVPVADLPATESPKVIGALISDLDHLVKEGQVAGPVATQLENALRQALRHAQAQRYTDAADAVNRFVNALENPKKTDTLEPEAKQSLESGADRALRTLT